MDLGILFWGPAPRRGLCPRAPAGHPHLPAGCPGRSSSPQPRNAVRQGARRKPVATSQSYRSQHPGPNLSHLVLSPWEGGGSRAASGGGRGWGAGAGHTFLDFLCASSRTAPWGRGREKISCEPRQRLRGTGVRGGGAQQNHTVSRLLGPWAPGHTRTWSRVCTGTHTGLKSWHIPGS